MANPLIHALVFGAAVVIPGGLLVYFAWLAIRARKEKFQQPEELPHPDVALAAFKRMYPPQSLRGQSRKKRIERARAFRRRNSEK